MTVWRPRTAASSSSCATDASSASTGSNSEVASVAKKTDGGVGSLEESFSSTLIHGKVFICIDNLRAQLNSQQIESFLTEDTFSARMPYKASVLIDPRRYLISITSNKAELTKDMANRSCIVRILKQPVGYRFKQYPEGDLAEHVRANWSKYLGAVFSVVMAYYDQGCPRTEECRHSFREWVQTMDWIVQNIFHLAPLLDGHEEAQIRSVNPHLTWLRAVALQLKSCGRVDEWLRTHQILDDIRDSDVEIPGCGDDAAVYESDTVILQAMGRKFKKCFGDRDMVTVDNLCIHRRESEDWEKNRMVVEYMFNERKESP